MMEFGGKLNRVLKISFILSAFFWYPGEKLIAQNPVIEDIVEELANSSDDEDQDYMTIVEDLSFLLDNPLNLNESNIESLERLHFLNDFQIENLLNYIASKGFMKSIFELQLVDGFDMPTIQKMLPFVIVAEPKGQDKIKFSELFRYGNNKLSAETRFLLQDQKGYQANYDHDSSLTSGPKYPGDRFKSLVRYRFNYKSKLFAGFTAEKDPGEKFEFENDKFGFDYYSFHLQANNLGKVKTVMIGDYQAKFGQGLVFWSGFGLGKSPDALNIRRKGQSIRYYSSTDENRFLRGVATRIKFGRFEATGLFSWKKIDANLTDPDTIAGIEEKITTFLNTGYHRTESELQNRKVIGEGLIGTRLAIGYERFKAGLNFVAYQYSLSVSNSDKPYKLFEITENSNINASIDYTYFAKKFYMFGEAAVSKNGSCAVLNGLVAKVVEPLSFSMLHRYYQKDYQAYYAGAFSENTKVGNEQGLYYGLVFVPIRKLRISAYADNFSFPWLKYGVDAPSGGSEYFIQADYSINRNIQMYFRWRNRSKGSNLPGSSSVFNSIVDECKQNFRYHINYRISPVAGFRSRIELVQFSKNDANQNGFLIFQDLDIDFRTIPLSVNMRYCLFDATYDSRIYAYESDMLYNFSIPSFSGRGSRVFVLLNYRFFKRLDLRVRYSQFVFTDRQVISSGNDEISGNIKSEFKVQMVLRF